MAKALWTQVPGAKLYLPKNKPRRPVQRVSKKRLEDLKTYRHNLKAWKKAHPKCMVCVLKGPGKKYRDPLPTKDPHHVYGRVGARFLDMEGCVPVCRECHQYIGENPRWAKENGLLKFNQTRQPNEQQ